MIINIETICHSKHFEGLTCHMHREASCSSMGLKVWMSPGFSSARFFFLGISSECKNGRWSHNKVQNLYAQWQS